MQSNTTTSFRQDLAGLLDSVARQVVYDAGRTGHLSFQQLRAVWKNDKLRGGMVAAGAQAVIPEVLLNDISPRFRDLLKNFIDKETGRIGNGLVNLAGGLPEPSLGDYVRILVRAAAVLGGTRTVQLLTGWIEGAPIRYRTIGLLTGVTVDQPLTLKEGLQLSQMPISSNELAAHVPPMSMDMYGIHAFLGRVALTIDCEAGPALYLPSGAEPTPSKMKHTWAGGRIENLSLDSFCESMSLACNGCVRWQFSWRDFGDIREFCSVYGGTSFTNVPLWGNTSSFTKDHFDQAREIHELRSTIGQNKPGLDTAIQRWIKSKSSESSLSDQFIELRIALEALYLDNTEGELRFRLATHGAWHIGSNMEERKKFHRTLLRSYRLASSAVHGGDVKRNEDNRKLLEDTQHIFQRGIMKRLKEKEVPKWNDIILGEGV